MSGRNVFRYILPAGLGALILLVMVVLLSGKDLAAANEQVEFIVGQKRYFTDGQVKNVDVAPFIEDGRTYIPVRYLAEALGASVNWESATRTVALTKGAVEVRFVIGGNTITVDGKSRAMDVVPLIKGGRTFLPARYVAEAFGYRVSWDANTKGVLVSLAGNLPASDDKSVYVKIAEIQRSPEKYVGKEITIRGTVTRKGTSVQNWYGPAPSAVPGLPPDLFPNRPIASKYKDFIQIDDGSGEIMAKFEKARDDWKCDFTGPLYGLKKVCIGSYRESRIITSPWELLVYIGLGDKVEVTGIVMKDNKKGLWIEGIRRE